MENKSQHIEDKNDLIRSDETNGKVIERLRMEYAALDDEIRKGKGDWYKREEERYVRDETWAAWNHTHTVLEDILKDFDVLGTPLPESK